MEKLDDLKISGIGKMKGGKFKSIDISGIGKIYGDIKANNIEISGSGNLEANVITEDINVSGIAIISGNLESNTTKCTGNLKVKGLLDSKEIYIDGRLSSGGDIKTLKIDIHGQLKAFGGVEAEVFFCEGAFKIGVLKANNVNIKMHWISYLKEICGETIKIKYIKHLALNVISYMMSNKYCLKSNIIEGTEIYLENTSVKLVSGCNVIIGPNCYIENLKYTNSVKIDTKSKVQNIMKV